MNLSARLSKGTRMGRAIARSAACCIMLLVLPSCGIPHTRKVDPAPCLPETFNGASSPENSALLTVEEFYNDPMLTGLIREALVGNRELRSLNEEVQIASNEILSRSGQYLPFISVNAGAGLDRASRFTLEGSGVNDDPFLPGRFLPNPRGNFLGGLNFTWQLDIYRQLRDARIAAERRYEAASERRNFFVTRMVADIAENYYRLMALDKRIENLNLTIELQERSLQIAEAQKEAGRGTELGVLRFRAEVRRNQSEKLIVNQDIIETENRINFLVNRFPQAVQRVSDGFFELTLGAVNVGVPSQLLQNRPDVRQNERNVAATGLDLRVARINFFPQLVLNAGTGLQAFDVRYLFEPQAVVGNIAGGLVGPLVNRRGIKAQYMTANAQQLQALYDYQRTILNAFTEVVNRITMVENYSNSLKIKTLQLEALSASVEVANNLFQSARTEYIDVLFAQRDLRDARMVLIDTKQQQLTAIVNAYQALGGGDLLSISNRVGLHGEHPYVHQVRAGEDFRTIAKLYYDSERYHNALWSANKKVVSAPDRLTVGDKIVIPRIEQLDPSLVEAGPGGNPEPPKDNNDNPGPPGTVPPVPQPTPAPPPAGAPGPFGQDEVKDPTVKPTSGTTTAADSPRLQGLRK